MSELITSTGAPLVSTIDQLPEAPTPLQTILEIARSGASMDLELLHGLMQIRRELEAEEAERAYNSAMAHTAARFPVIPKNGRNTHTKSDYALFEDVDRLCRPIYTAEGLSVSFWIGPADEKEYTRYWCTVRHQAGHSTDRYIDLPDDRGGMRGNENKNPVQAKGSSMSYAKRYLMFMVFSLAQAKDPDDDDGQAAHVTREQVRQPTAKKAKQMTRDECITDLIKRCDVAGLNVNEVAQSLGLESVHAIEKDHIEPFRVRIHEWASR